MALIFNLVFSFCSSDIKRNPPFTITVCATTLFLPKASPLFNSLLKSISVPPKITPGLKVKNSSPLTSKTVAKGS
ncbi:hypothetical protein [Aquimarina aggregata]|uniref:hypothetical protein n=1 Tax=Aquimarina aggregata TaxID=1642818 RepID=UPI0031EDADB4